MINAAPAEADLTPPLGTRKIGWLRTGVGPQVLLEAQDVATEGALISGSWGTF